MAKLAEFHNLFPSLRESVKTGKPVWGTCAGLIILADKAFGQKSGGQELIGGLDCTVHRNFYSSQLVGLMLDLFRKYHLRIYYVLLYSIRFKVLRLNFQFLKLLLKKVALQLFEIFSFAL